ncbi:hypothetical protein [Streptomyces sp. ISL-100]|uniref:hypothetical protein n=1 Tax=Streptomyces sp. ISL-100 TaxID=2819173 RepID=UPI001BEBE1BF|nr:hypothetical protein [Streptomyces sp. ISL-100]MBT2396261.1 hypothetical protein [Streptomyces sp. ISL-100]
MRRLSGEIGSRSARRLLLGELLPLEGWMNVELHCHLDGAGPSDRHPDLTQVLVSVPPPEWPGGIDPRVEALADYISRTMELGAGIDEIDREMPGRSEQYRYLAEALVPWLLAAPRRELKDAWDRGYKAASAQAITP